MDLLQSKVSGSSLEASRQEFPFCEPSELPAIKGSSYDKFKNLQTSKDRFCRFVDELGEGRCSKIRKDVLVHCSNSKKGAINQSSINEESILKLMDLRIQKMIKNKRLKKNWNEEDVHILIWVISKYADKKGLNDIQKDLDEKDWEVIASLIPGVTGESCMFKWLSLKRVNLASSNWSDEQSNLLAKLMSSKDFKGKKEDTKDWKMISQRLYFLNSREDKIFRDAKQCREHWNCYLNPNLKRGPWKPEEDIQLLKCIKENKGSKKWSEIVKHFDGRTENALKNRYTLILDKQKKRNKHKPELEIIEEYLVKCYLDQFTTEVKHCPQEEEVEESALSIHEPIKEEGVSVEDSFQTPRKGEVEPNNTNYFNNSAVTTITPLKIQRFDEFLSFISSQKIDPQSIRLAIFSNGVFQDLEGRRKRNSIEPPAEEGQLSLTRQGSSFY